MTYSYSLIVDNNFVESCFHKATSNVLELFSSLDKKVVPFWNLDRDPLACVSSPDMQTWIA